MIKDRQLDPEWVDLILEALEIGVSVDEIKDFLIKKGSPAV
nr:anti-repressor SinI family protein [Metabacillus litoralis]